MFLKFLRPLALVLTALALGGTVLPAEQQRASDLSIAELQGAWRQVDGGVLLNVRDGQLFKYENGQLSILGIVRRRPDALVVRNLGELETWHASLNNGVLELGRDKLKVFHKLKNPPSEVELHPIKLGKPHRLPPDRIRSEQEIANRNEREQAVLKNPAQAAQAPALREDNLQYLKRLVQKIGWLDTARFGEKTSVQATILLKHTGNLALMMAALPEVERDLKFTGDGQTYAVLYDGLLVQLGKKQRYGTQIGEDAKGNPYVLALENPAKVDDYLKELGLPPLSNYLADVSKYLYDGKPVRLATAEESD
ncbi:MAG: hypothetical protein M3O15_08750 [Acidobacteriota bacterium]|nr:hypothetical protein [Acidobacteriota bacterium]